MSEVAETTTITQSEKIVRSQQPGELQNIQATYRLDGKNYLKWSQLVRTVLKRKKKINHLMTTHVCSRLQQRIFGTQSNRHIQKLDMRLKYMRLRVMKTKYPKDVAALKDFIEQDRVYDFLVRLNPKFDQVRIQILSKQEVPCFNEVVETISGRRTRTIFGVSHQAVNGEIVEGSKGLKYTWQSSLKLRKIQQQAGSIVKKWRS
ncbi:hypothetical protein CK203_014796 [Vitis vinifera]|uniref:Retrotransposon Copia-like N-terminal domain-containing protein n=1 Tax=Vitis vinifera TaxID=29760 RepID=A0A438JG26_VITVI|nr:hypothetical protein CK203_014796 [Vitis vinifera]